MSSMHSYKSDSIFNEKVPRALSLLAVLFLLPHEFVFGAEGLGVPPAQHREVQSAVSQAVGVVASRPSAENCNCENVSCEVCEREDGIEFYTAKCGVDGSKVKSCQRPKCVPVENQAKCLALFQKPALPAIGAVAPRTEVSQEFAPMLKSVAAPLSSSHVAGQITLISGAVRLFRASGGVEVAHENSRVFVGDRFETLGDARVRILLRDQSEVTLAPHSALKFTRVEIDASGENRRVLLDLEHGKVRNHVFKILASGSSYQVRTANIIASVHGTDFLTAFEVDPTAWTSQVDTFDGVVRLERVMSPNHQESFVDQFVDIAAGNSGTFRAPIRGSDENENEYVEALIQSPLPIAAKVNAGEMLARRIDVSFVVDGANPKPLSPPRQPASVKTPELICGAPSGAFNQCSFTCEGNPKSEKTCRTDLKGVTCVRRICNANGVWADETRMPAAKLPTQLRARMPVRMPDCVPQKQAVRECGNYW